MTVSKGKRWLEQEGNVFWSVRRSLRQTYVSCSGFWQWRQQSKSQDPHMGSRKGWEAWRKQMKKNVDFTFIHSFIQHYVPIPFGLPQWLSGKQPTRKAGEVRDTGSIPGWEDPLEKGRATDSSIFAWRIPWTEKPGGYSPCDRKELDMTEVTYHTCMHLFQLWFLIFATCQTCAGYAAGLQRWTALYLLSGN